MYLRHLGQRSQNTQGAILRRTVMVRHTFPFSDPKTESSIVWLFFVCRMLGVRAQTYYRALRTVHIIRVQTSNGVRFVAWNTQAACVYNKKQA